jgi:hypothetical protein
MERTVMIDKGFTENDGAFFKWYLLASNGGMPVDYLDEDFRHAMRNERGYLKKFAGNKLVGAIRKYHGDLPVPCYGASVISSGFGKKNPMINATFIRRFEKGEALWADMNYEGSYMIPTNEVPGSASKILAGEKDLLRVHDYNIGQWRPRFAFSDADLSTPGISEEPVIPANPLREPPTE